MIGRDELAESARYQDALAEEHKWLDYCKLVNVDPEGLEYVAHQRALRAVMLIDGQDPSKRSRTEKTTVDLSPQAESLLLPLTALAMDGIAIGLDAARKARS